MNEMYETYKEVAEFRIVYIREAHAADSDRPNKLAKEKNATILAFTGKTNSKLEQIADICFCAEGSTARSQEIHQLGYHIICKLVEQSFYE